MSDLNVSSWSAGNVQLVSEGRRFSFRTGQAQGNQGTSSAMGSVPAVEVPRQAQGASAHDLSIQNATTTGGPLLAALNAMGSLKVRVFDSHNHGVQTEILRLVEMANGNDEYANEAKEILVALAQNETTKPLLIKSLASTIGGAPWIAKSSESGMASAADAAKAFLALTDGENPPLSHDDCKGIFGQLNKHKVFSTKGAPIWEATQSLSIEERTQLGDCFGDFPRSVYGKSREYSKLSVDLKFLEGRIGDFSRENGDLSRLNDSFRIFNVDLAGSGFSIPKNLNTNSPRADFSESLVESARANVNAFIETWSKFRENSQDLEPEDRALCEAFQKAQGQFGGEQKTLNSLKREISALKKELEYTGLNFSQRDVLSGEFQLRRDLMAGKPNATLEDCWNAAVDYQGSEIETLGYYDEWTSIIDKQIAQFEQMKTKYLELHESQEPFSFENGIQLAKQMRDLAVSLEQCRQKLDPIIIAFAELGGVPNGAHIESKVSNNPLFSISNMVKNLLKKMVDNLLPGHKIKDIEKYLEEHTKDTNRADANNVIRMKLAPTLAGLISLHSSNATTWRGIGSEVKEEIFQMLERDKQALEGLLREKSLDGKTDVEKYNTILDMLKEHLSEMEAFWEKNEKIPGAIKDQILNALQKNIESAKEDLKGFLKVDQTTAGQIRQMLAIAREVKIDN
jgi:hypothetical protein